MEKVLVLGASEKEERYSNKAVKMLVNKGYHVLAVGGRYGKIDDVDILTKIPSDHEIDTVTLYLNPKRQVSYYQQLINLSPRRVIFNPGTENKEFQNLLKKEEIKIQEGCTLVMLSTGLF